MLTGGRGCTPPRHPSGEPAAVVAAALLTHADLSRLVRELTEHPQAPDQAGPPAVPVQVRTRGDDRDGRHRHWLRGAESLPALRPHVVELALELIGGAARETRVIGHPCSSVLRAGPPVCNGAQSDLNPLLGCRPRASEPLSGPLCPGPQLASLKSAVEGALVSSTCPSTR
ncbi:hypothetical protein Krad_2665 [Kineococcus radiotolerans SRS30216 = ATCC BAA-149]|uniref:Uncharacterized protein n=1 Tax=Kineococcus radiotolerans (strain ATCC BAA-149 / DSM 14245 / SRS30216) TaxID=266940 RepID=A6WBE8_KINRD|nr:hypothetical protein Krad_2665 [Kineococcus radiotolerans SRS30216 = ATCC BAA-149]